MSANPVELRFMSRGAPRERAETVMVPMHDGVRLATDVYLPAATGSGVPAILIRTPYDAFGREIFPWAIAEYLVERGYAAVVQDVRGKFRSEGVAFPRWNEPQDGYDTLEWISRQAWSDGIVGMHGYSYLGSVQWSAVASGHPALRAISPAVVAPEHVLASRQGVPWLARAEWLVNTWTFADRIDFDVWDWSGRPFIDNIPAAAERGRRIVEHTHRAPGDRDYHLGVQYPGHEVIRRLAIPALHLGGWWDPLAEGQLRDFTIAAACSRAPERQFLRFGAVDHVDIHYADLVDHCYDDEALERYLPRALDPVVAFFDRFLRGRDTPAPPTASYEVAWDGWRTATSWPPPGIEEQTLYLASPGRALEDANGGALAPVPQERGRTSWIHDPADPVPSLVANEWGPLYPPSDQQPAHARPDVATFTTDPMQQPLDLVGPIVLDLEIGTTGPSGHVMAVLSDVAPDGSALMMREGTSYFEPFESDTVHVALHLGQTAYRVRPGHRLRLAISGSAFPRYIVHPGTAEDPWYAEHTERRQHSLYTGGGFGSRITLSVQTSR
jgi:uncharacterized protein